MNNVIRIDRRAMIVLIALVLLAVVTLAIGSVMRAGAASHAESAAAVACSTNCKTSTPPNVVCGNSPDGRMDPVCLYPDQSAAVYCTEDGGIDMYSVALGVGRFDFHVTPEELEATLNPKVNTLVAQGSNSQGINVQLWRLTDNRLEVVSPLPPDHVTQQVKMFIFIWDGC